MKRRKISALLLILLTFCLASLSACSRGAAPTVSITYNSVIGTMENGVLKILEGSDSGGTITGDNVQTVTIGGRAGKVTANADTGYVFLGWSDGVTAAERQDVVDQSVSIYAVFGKLYSSLPVINVYTDNQQSINDDNQYVKCLVSLDNCDDEFIFENLRAGVRLRGNSTLKYPKKPYRLKFDAAVQPLGIGNGEARNWVLLAEYSDSSYMRNYLTYLLAGGMENISYSTDCTFVELYLNNDYAGVYLLAEQVEVSNIRVDIDTAGKKDPLLLDTGYLLELEASEQRRNQEGMPNLDWIAVPGYAINKDTSSEHSGGSDTAFYVIKSDAKSAEQARYIKQYMKDVYDAVYKRQGSVMVGDTEYLCGTRQAVEALIDIDSAVDMYILQLLANDYDGNFSSSYVYKDAGGKLVFSVPWDFDLAYGNYKEHTEYDSVYMFHLLRGLERFEWFREAAYMRFLKLTEADGALSIALAAADEMNLAAKAAFERDAELYGMGKGDTWGTEAASQSDAYASFREWIDLRIIFMGEYLRGNADIQAA